MEPQFCVVANPNPDVDNEQVSILRRGVRSAFDGANGLERTSVLDEVYRRYLRTEGKGFRTNRGAIWVDSSGRSWEPGSAEFQSFLAYQGGAPAGAADFIAAVKGAIRTVCYVEHRGEARPVGLSAAGSDGAIYVRRDERSMFRIDDAISIVSNGTNGLLLRPVDGFDDLGALPSPTPPGGIYPWWPLFTAIAFADFGCSIFGAAILAATLIFLLLPRAMAGVAPALAFIGPAGSGKTTAARVCSILLCGQALVEMPPDTWAADSFETALARLLVLPVDDFDEADPKFAAIIRAVVTGARRTRRKKYSDDDLHLLEPDVRLMFATNACPLPATEANVSRLVPIRFAERTDGFLVEGTLERQAAELRTQFWADALELLRRLRPALASAFGVGQRLAGWERFIRTLAAHVPGWAPHLPAALTTIEQVRSDLQLADDIVAEYVSQLVPTSDCMWQGSASELLLTFREGPGRSLWGRWTPERLAKRLVAIAPALRRAMGINVTRVSRSATTRGYQIRRQ
jgi:hypothetical protein